MKTIIKIAAVLAFVPVLVGCSSSSNQSESQKFPCPFTAEQMKLDSADQKEIADWREYAKTGKLTDRIKDQGIDRNMAALLVSTYDTAMIPCK